MCLSDKKMEDLFAQNFLYAFRNIIAHTRLKVK